jgi:pyruvate, orthophosphate dikinase
MSFLTESLDKIAHWVLPEAKKKYIYHLSEGSARDVSFLSRKATALCEIDRLGFNVPPAFIISADASTEFHTSELNDLDDNILGDIKTAIDTICRTSLHKFDAPSGLPPLLLSVRGGSLVNPNMDVSFEEGIDSVNTDIVDILGAPESWCIPGVKESCLGIGMNDEVAEHLASIATPFIAYNTYAHFLVRFGTIVLGASRDLYHRVLSDHLESTGRFGSSLTVEDLQEIVENFKLIAAVPKDPYVQLSMSIIAMYRCWFSPSAVQFRTEALHASSTAGLAIIVQTIALGDTGVGFTRNPVTGEEGPGIFGTFWAKSGEKLALDDEFQLDNKIAFEKLVETSRNLELHFKDMLQFEFVYCQESTVLYILQVSNGRRTPKASMKIAVDMVKERLLTEREALLRIDATKSGSYFLQQHMNMDELDTSKIFGEFCTG